MDTAGIYDGTGDGDKDAKDFVAIRNARLVQEGKQSDSVFKVTQRCYYSESF